MCALNKTDPQLCSIICWRLSQLASLLAVWFYDLVKLDHRGHDCVGHCFCLCVPRAARVAVVKSRDMHWSLLAQRDQRDISLSSLRMLIVADGANPCESICRGSFNKTTPWSPKKLLLICFVCLPGALCVCVTPGSISSCDAFLNVFQSRGLRPEVICPCASSSEAMTVAIRRCASVTAPDENKSSLFGFLCCCYVTPCLQHQLVPAGRKGDLFC